MLNPASELGYRPTRSQQLFLAQKAHEKLGHRSESEVLVVHHVLQDTPLKLHLQVERRCPVFGISFDRVTL